MYISINFKITLDIIQIYITNINHKNNRIENNSTRDICINTQLTPATNLINNNHNTIMLCRQMWDNPRNPINQIISIQIKIFNIRNNFTLTLPSHNNIFLQSRARQIRINPNLIIKMFIARNQNILFKFPSSNLFFHNLNIIPFENFKFQFNLTIFNEFFQNLFFFYNNLIFL